MVSKISLSQGQEHLTGTPLTLASRLVPMLSLSSHILKALPPAYSVQASVKNQPQDALIDSDRTGNSLDKGR